MDTVQYTNMLLVFQQFFPAQKNSRQSPKITIFVTFFGAYTQNHSPPLNHAMWKASDFEIFRTTYMANPMGLNQNQN